jgi:hypothetical protein
MVFTGLTESTGSTTPFPWKLVALPAICALAGLSLIIGSLTGAHKDPDFNA